MIPAPARSAVMEALKDKRFTRRFKILVDALRRGEQASLKVTVMIFINALINGLDLLERRVEIRREFIDLDLLKVRYWAAPTACGFMLLM